MENIAYDNGYFGIFMLLPLAEIQHLDALFYLYTQPQHTSALYINEVVPAQRTCALVTALEPPEQTHRMEGVLASRAPLVRRLHVRRDYRVTDGTLALALQRSLHVPPECHQSILQIAVGEHDHSLDCDQPILPPPLVNKDPASSHDQCWLQGIGRGE